MKLIITILLTTLTLMLTACGEDTSSPLKDVVSIKINEVNQSMYSTDTSISLSATLTYDDGSTDDATKYVEWKSSTDKLSVSTLGVVSVGPYNGGDSNISISYKTLTDGPVAIHLIKMTDFNITMLNAENNVTGTYSLLATGIFEDGNNTTIVKNISWDLNNSATVSGEGNETQITVVAGDTNITATVFINDNDYNQTQEIIYTAN